MRPQRVGRLTVQRVIEKEDSSPLPLLLPDITAADLERAKRWLRDPDVTSDPATSRIALSMHSFVIQVGGQNILVDACNGNHKPRSVPFASMLQTSYLQNLAAVGLEPEDIHLVLCTHLHFDHVGWNTRLENGRWVPTFRNARYVFSKRDYDHLATDFAELPHREAYEDSVLPVVAAGLATIVDVEGSSAVYEEIGDGVWLEAAFGHSPGSCLIKARAGGDVALFWGDVIHHPVQLARPDLALPFDFDKPAAVKARIEMLERIADTGTMCFPAHFRGTTAGRVRRDGTAFSFEFV